MENYFEFQINFDHDLREQLIAELAEADYEGFIESETGFSAYIPTKLFDREIFEQLLTKYGIDPASIPQNTIQQQNWNAQWEATYEPIIVADKVLVKAPFHQLNENYEYVITIQPKNTFGTGHHATTQLMLQLMLNVDFKNKKVLDYGCGTGVLGFMALKKEAQSVVGIDIDEWCEENIAENKALNNAYAFEFRKGDLSVIKNDEKFDVVLANINKNILLDSFTFIQEHMAPQGLLLISGFYETDLQQLKAAAESGGLKYVQQLVQDSWCAAVFSS